MKTKNLAVKTVLMLAIFLLVPIVGSSINKEQAKKGKSTTVVVVGFPNGQAAGFQRELEEAAKYKKFLDKGDELARQGRADDAVKEYEAAFSFAKISGAKAVAIFAIADVYEKSNNYKDALKQIIIIRDKYVSDWAKAPIVERVIYLEHALRGEYDLAVKHAQRALEENGKLPNVPQGGSPDYIQRLEDLKAAKDYILSLKKR